MAANNHTTSSLSERERGEEHSLTIWRHRANEFCCLSAAGICLVRKTTGNARAVFMESKYRAKETWMTRTGKDSSREFNTMSAATPRSMGRRYCGSVSRTSEKSGTMAASRRLAADL